MSLLEDIATLLETAGIGTRGVDLFLGDQPPLPDTCVALFETGGQAPLHIHELSGPAIEHAGVQVLLRALLYTEAKSLAERTYQELDGLTNTTINQTFYLGIRALHSPASLGRDPHQRAELSVNFRVDKDPHEGV